MPNPPVRAAVARHLRGTLGAGESRGYGASPPGPDGGSGTSGMRIVDRVLVMQRALLVRGPLVLDVRTSTLVGTLGRALEARVGQLLAAALPVRARTLRTVRLAAQPLKCFTPPFPIRPSFLRHVDLPVREFGLGTRPRLRRFSGVTVAVLRRQSRHLVGGHAQQRDTPERYPAPYPTRPENDKRASTSLECGG
jgi:hypothetical protein